MVEFLIFIYAMLGFFVMSALHRNQREQRPSPQMVTLVGWGLYSLSSTLALLLLAVAVAVGLGATLPGFDPAAF